MFFPLSFSISLWFAPVIIIIAISEMCPVCVPSKNNRRGDVCGKYIAFRAQRRHCSALTKNGSIVVLLRVSLNKLWPKNTSGLTGYCYSRINLFFISFVFFLFFFPEYAEKCILYRKWNWDIRNASKDAEVRYVKFKYNRKKGNFLCFPCCSVEKLRGIIHCLKIDEIYIIFKFWKKYIMLSTYIHM